MKKYVKHSLTFLVITVLLVSLNLNAFCASSSFSYRLADFSFLEGDKPSGFDVRVDSGKTVTRVGFNSATDVRVVIYYTLTNEFKLGSNYTLSFSASRGPTLNTSSITLFLTSSLNALSDENSLQIAEFSTDELSSTSYKDFSFQVRLPDSFNGKQVYLVAFILADKGSSSLWVTDFVFSNNNSLEGNVDIPDTSDFDKSLGQLEQFEKDLPQIDKEQFNTLFNFDFSRFTSSMAFVRNMFDRTIEALNFDAVLVFALAIGLATYIIGKRVK